MLALSKGVYNKDYCGIQDTKTQIIQDAPSKTHIMLVNKNIAPSKLPMEVDERGDAFQGIPKLWPFGVLGLSWGCHGHTQA